MPRYSKAKIKAFLSAWDTATTKAARGKAFEELACYLFEKVPGIRVVNRTFFNEFAVQLPRSAAEVVETLAGNGVLAGVPVSRFYPERGDLADLLLVAATEMTTAEDISRLEQGLREVLS